jgi:hypothetical protein
MTQLETILSARHIFCVCIASDETRGYSWLISTRNHPRWHCLQIGCPQKVHKISSRSKLWWNVLDRCIFWRFEGMYNVSMSEYSKTYPKKSLQIIKFCLSQDFLISKSSGISSFYHLKWPSHNEIPFSGQSRLHCLGRIPSKLMVNNHILASWIPSFLLISPIKFAINIMIDKNYYTYPCQ